MIFLCVPFYDIILVTNDLQNPPKTPHKPPTGRGFVRVRDVVPVPVPPHTLDQYPRGYAYPCQSLQGQL